VISGAGSCPLYQKETRGEKVDRRDWSLKKRPAPVPGDLILSERGNIEDYRGGGSQVAGRGDIGSPLRRLKGGVEQSFSVLLARSTRGRKTISPS